MKDLEILKRLTQYTVPELRDGMEMFRIMDWQIKPEEAAAILKRAERKVRSQEYTRQEMERTGTVIPRVLELPEE